MIEIGKGISIHKDELIFKTSRSGGPGGQNVNKVNTRITLLFDVANCNNFSDVQKQQILKRLSTRADKNGVVRVVSQKFRAQRANRTAALERLSQLLTDALKTHHLRKKTRVPERSRRQRLEQKKQRSLLKQQRVKKSWSEDM